MRAQMTSVEDIEEEFPYGKRVSLHCCVEDPHRRDPMHMVRVSGVVRKTYWEKNGDFVVVVMQDNKKFYYATFTCHKEKGVVQ